MVARTLWSLRVAALLIFIGAVADALACKCSGPGPPEFEYAQSSAVFRGRLVSGNEIRAGNRTVVIGPDVVFEATKHWKGTRRSRIVVRNEFGCSYYGFERGKEYVVYARGPSLAVSMCGRVQDAANVEIEMTILDVLTKGGKELTVMRRLPDYLLKDPRSGVRAEAAQLLVSDAPRDIAAAAIPALVRAVHDPALAVRRNAIQALDGDPRLGGPWSAGPWHVDPLGVDDKTKMVGRALIQALNDPEPSIRREAARVLWKSWALPETEPALRAALASEQARAKPGPEVISAIASTLATVGKRDSKRLVVPLLVRELKSPETGMRWNAAEKLGWIGQDALPAVGPLAETLRDPEKFVRYHVAEALGSIGSRQAVPSLIRSLRDEDLDVRAQAAFAIYRIGDEQSLRVFAVPTLMKGLERVSDSYHIVRILGEMGPSAHRAVPALARTLSVVPGYRTGQVAAALGEIGPRAKQAVPALLQAFARADDTVQWTIINTLDAIDDRSPNVVRTLQAALDDRDDQVRYAAAETLVKWRSPKAARFLAERIVPSLLSDLRSSDVEKRRRGATELSRWGARAFPAVPTLSGGLTDRDPQVRTACATALGEIGPAAWGAVPRLIEMLELPEESLEAATALGGIGDRAALAVPHIRPLLDHPRPWTRARAAEALRKIGTPEARQAFEAFAAKEIPILVAWLRDRNRSDRGEAARCLIHLAPKSRDAFDALVQGLTDSDWLTRTKSAEALGALGTLAEAAIPHLARTLNDRSRFPRHAASSALEQIGSPAARRALAEFYRPPPSS